MHTSSLRSCEREEHSRRISRHSWSVQRQDARYLPDSGRSEVSQKPFVSTLFPPFRSLGNWSKPSHLLSDPIDPAGGILTPAGNVVEILSDATLGLKDGLATEKPVKSVAEAVGGIISGGRGGVSDAPGNSAVGVGNGILWGQLKSSKVGERFCYMLQ